MGRRTIIDRLPKDVREAINNWRTNESLTIDEILGRLKEEYGVEIKRATMGLHVQKLEDVGRRIRMARAVAEGIAPTISGKDEGELLNMNINLLHSGVMQVLSATDEDGKDVQLTPAQAMAIGKALESSSKAAKINADRVLKIRQETAKETAQKAATVAVAAVEKEFPGVSAAFKQSVYHSVLGVGKT